MALQAVLQRRTQTWTLTWPRCCGKSSWTLLQAAIAGLTVKVEEVTQAAEAAVVAAGAGVVEADSEAAIIVESRHGATFKLESSPRD